jgi:hypothetical protein
LGLAGRGVNAARAFRQERTSDIFVFIVSFISAISNTLLLLSHQEPSEDHPD